MFTARYGLNLYIGFRLISFFGRLRSKIKIFALVAYVYEKTLQIVYPLLQITLRISVAKR